MTTIKDIAEQAGVSFKTVSRVINGVPTVSRELNKRGRASIAALNYVPKQSARRLRGAATTVAFVYDNPNSHYVVELQEGIIGACRQRNFEVMIHPGCGNAAADRRDVVNLARRADVGGLILTPPLSEDDSFVKRRVKAGTKLLGGQIVRSPGGEKPLCSVGITPEVVLRESTAAPGGSTAAE